MNMQHSTLRPFPRRRGTVGHEGGGKPRYIDIAQYRVSIEGVKNLCPMLKILVCQFRIYSPRKRTFKIYYLCQFYIILLLNLSFFSISEHAKLSSLH